MFYCVSLLFFFSFIFQFYHEFVISILSSQTVLIQNRIILYKRNFGDFLQITTQLFIFIFLIYWAFIYWLNKKGILSKYNITAYGPILMIETDKGLYLLDKIAVPRRFWRLFANIGIVLMFAGMIFMFSLVVFSDIILVQSMFEGVVMEPNELTEIQNIFLIPGINQFIPFVWGLAALVIAVFIHEMMHSVLARAEGVRVHSVGLIAALFPIGGFAKIDDRQLYGDELDALNADSEPPDIEFNDLIASIEEIREHEREDAENKIVPDVGTTTPISDKKDSGSAPKIATKTQRSRILAAGVMSNFCVALIAAMLFFGPVIGAMSPVGTLQIMDSDDFSMAAGLQKEMILTEINGMAVTNAASVTTALENVTPGDPVTVKASHNRQSETYTVTTNASAENVNYAGILVSRLESGGAAEAAGIVPNSIIYKIDDEFILDSTHFSNVMNTKNPGDVVVLSVKILGENGTVSGTDEISATLGANPQNASSAYLGIYHSAAPLYVGLLGISVGVFDAPGYLAFLERLPSLLYTFDFSKPVESVMTIISALIFVMSMPFLTIFGSGFGGFSGTLMQFFEPVGWAAPLGVGIFWIANLLYWVGWLNFYVGLFNCLPAIPLDGGHLFRTYFLKVTEKFNMDPQKAIRLSFHVSSCLTGFIFLSFLFMFIWPHISSYVLGIFN